MDSEYKPEMISINDLARMLGVSQKTVYRMLKDGRVPKRLIHWGPSAGILGGLAMTFRFADIEAWVAKGKRTEAEERDAYQPGRISYCGKVKVKSLPGY